LKKLMILAAMLALAVALAVPAIAQVGLETGNESESDSVEMEFGVENTGDYASQCVPALQFGNSGNFNNAPTFLQYASEADDFEPGGIEFAVEPEMEVDCSSEVQQSSAASSGW
jgi:hypothetical protein